MPFTPATTTVRAALSLAAAAALLAAGLALPASSLPLVALVAGVLLAAEAIDVPHVTRGMRFRWSLGATVVLAALFAAGPHVALLALPVCVFAVEAHAAPGWTRIDRIAGTVVALSLAGGAFGLAGGTAGALSLPSDFLPLLAGVGTFAIGYVLLTQALPEVMTSRHQRRTMHELAMATPQQVALVGIEGLFGALVALVVAHEPWAAPLLLPPAVSLHLAMSRGARMRAISDQALEAFASIVDERDHYTAEHSQRVCSYAMMIGRQMGLAPAELERLYWTSRLHDLGKVSVDEAILNKPGRLTDEEFDVIRQHPVVSARILNEFSFHAREAEIVLCHHERYDGRGYLRRTSDDVPLEAFIIAVADTFDAMTSDRPYRRALSRQAALEEIRNNIGTQFHPAAAQAFLEAMDGDGDGGVVVDLASARTRAAARVADAPLHEAA